MNAIITLHSEKWFGERGVDISTVVLFAMHCTEIYNRDIRHLTGSTKLRTALDAVEVIVEEGDLRNFWEPEMTGKLRGYVQMGESLLVPIIEAVVIVSKHPQVVQLVGDLKANCAGRCKPSARAPKSASKQ